VTRTRFSAPTGVLNVDLFQLDGFTNPSNGYCQLGDGSIRREAVLYVDDETTPTHIPGGGQVAGDDVATLTTAGTLAVNCWATPHTSNTATTALRRSRHFR
jgi:hypothetical protein